jgi:Ni/Fe-hydrogenase subunit HybB-like protein
MWGVYIITFVFWVGIGHAGTLISAILYLFRAGFRTTIYRVSEAMAVFAVMTAGLFPIIRAYLFLAAFSTPLVLSVHSVVQLPVFALAESKEIVPPKLRAAHTHDDHIDVTGRHQPYEPDTPGEFA